ncbi:hypothetical protein [Sulfuriferula multivorans]|uniref:hypothetical protein n=1 Tax=Sulfuriferula multivorans TaxID=1559896 RepID=UPI000F5C2765|nr:hypothetical protein [Sulfuriferula multivorans]
MTKYINVVGDPAMRANPHTQEIRLRIVGLVIISVPAFLPRLAMLQASNHDLIDHLLPWQERTRIQRFWRRWQFFFSRYGWRQLTGISEIMRPEHP